MFLRSARATNHWSAQHLEGGKAASRSAKVSLNSCRLEKDVIAEGYRIFNDESYQIPHMDHPLVSWFVLSLRQHVTAFAFGDLQPSGVLAELQHTP